MTALALVYTLRAQRKADAERAQERREKTENELREPARKAHAYIANAGWFTETQYEIQLKWANTGDEPAYSCSVTIWDADGGQEEVVVGAIGPGVVGERYIHMLSGKRREGNLPPWLQMFFMFTDASGRTWSREADGRIIDYGHDGPIVHFNP